MGKRVHRNITIRGRVYPTAQAAARALGVQDQTIHRAARLGVLDRVGVGKGRREPMPVRVRGVVYENAAAAAEATGLTKNAIYNAISKGRADRVGLPPQGLSSSARPFVIGPMTFPSQTAAEQALGFSRGYISRARRMGWPLPGKRMLAAAMALSDQRRAA